MIKGSIVALVTPFAKTGEVDLDALARLVDWHIAEGTDSIVAVGTTGESATLNVDEHCKVIEHVVAIADGKVPIIAGTGANSTSEAIELTEAARNAGADACLLVTPYYNKPNQRGLFEHYWMIADSVDIPQILYNVPGRTACDMLPETIGKLAEHPNIVGVKEATGDLQRGRDVISLCPDGFAVYSGDDAIAKDFILAGGHGNISVTANVAPAVMHRMCAFALAGDAAAATAENDKVESLHQALFLESNPIPVKWALKEMGMIGSGIRLPLVELDARFHTELRSALQKSGVI